MEVVGIIGCEVVYWIVRLLEIRRRARGFRLRRGLGPAVLARRQAFTSGGRPSENVGRWAFFARLNGVVFFAWQCQSLML